MVAQVFRHPRGEANVPRQPQQHSPGAGRVQAAAYDPGKQGPGKWREVKELEGGGEGGGEGREGVDGGREERGEGEGEERGRRERRWEKANEKRLEWVRKEKPGMRGEMGEVPLIVLPGTNLSDFFCFVFDGDGVLVRTR